MNESEPWFLDVTAPNRAAAIASVRRAALPPLAEDYFVGLISGEAYVHSGRVNPDTPIRVVGHGTDHGDLIMLERGQIEYQ